MMLILKIISLKSLQITPNLMLKNLLPYLLLFIPFLSFAQNGVGLIKDFSKDVKGFSRALQLSDKVNLVEVTTDNEHFDLIALDANMSVLWKTTLNGYSLSFGKFKDKILVIAATEYSSMNGSNNTYKGFLIDPITGKILLEKVVYNNSQGYVEKPYFFHGKDGAFFKLAVRQNNMKRKLHVVYLGHLLC